MMALSRNLKMPKRDKNGFTFIEAFIASFIVIILWSMAQPNIHKSRSRFTKVQNECLKNQRILEGSLEYYNMDNSIQINNVYPGLDYEKCEKTLIDTHYLKDPIQPTYEGCSYGYIEINNHNIIFCKIHGSLESSSDSHKELSVPEYDKSLEKPFSSDYNNFRNKIINEKKREKILKDLEKEILNNFPLFMIVFVFLFAFLSTIFVKKQKEA